MAKKTRARWTLVTASAKPGNIGTSFEIGCILSLPDEIVKCFAEVGSDAGLRGCSSFFCKFETKRKAQGEHLTNSLPCARSAMAPKRGLTNEAHPNGSGIKRFAKIGSASVSTVCLLRVIRRKNKRKKSDNK